MLVSPLISLTGEVAFLKSNCLSELLSDESLVSLAEFAPAREIADHGRTWPMLNLNFLNLTGKPKSSNKSTFFFISRLVGRASAVQREHRTSTPAPPAFQVVDPIPFCVSEASYCDGQCDKASNHGDTAYGTEKSRLSRRAEPVNENETGGS